MQTSLKMRNLFELEQLIPIGWEASTGPERALYARGMDAIRRHNGVQAGYLVIQLRQLKTLEELSKRETLKHRSRQHLTTFLRSLGRPSYGRVGLMRGFR